MGPIVTIVRVSPTLHGTSNNVSIHPVGETLPETTTLRTCQVAPYQTVSSNIFHTIYINSQLPRIFPSIFLSFPNTMGHRPQGEKLPPIHCTMDTKGKGSRLLISPVKQKNIKKLMSFQSQTGNECDLHQTTTMGKISSPILSFVS